SLSVALARRISIREDGDTRLSLHQFQGVPENGYTQWIAQMLVGIPVMLGYAYTDMKDAVEVRKKTIYTGPIDEFYGYSLGKLKYRSQERSHSYYGGIHYIQPTVQANFPSPEQTHVRTIEWKHMRPEG